MWVDFIFKKVKKSNCFSLFVFVYPPSFTPCILIYLYINPSDLTLPQITWQSPPSQSTCLPIQKIEFDVCKQLYSLSLTT